MAKRVQLIRHNTANADAFQGKQGEVTVDLTKKELRLHDGLTAGGVPHARADLANVDDATASTAGKMSAADKTQLDANTVKLSGIENNANNYVHASGLTDLEITQVAPLTGAAVIDELTTSVSVNDEGHVISMLFDSGTRNLLLSDLGIYHGRVTNNATPGIVQGNSAVNTWVFGISAGVTTVNHNLGHSNYTVVITNNDDNYSDGRPDVTIADNNFAVTWDGISTAREFSFILALD